ncbi:MAG: flagellar motor switch protein FliN [Bacillota bacterium]|jgi:flagellar motor switch protein FliN/FliY|nr:flagellar motor switch protein FliN [Candidatus Fermentithermobacillaceae bacterium]
MRNENLSQEEIEQLLRQAEQAHEEARALADEAVGQAEPTPEEAAKVPVEETVEDTVAEMTVGDVGMSELSVSVKEQNEADVSEVPKRAEPSIRVAEFQEFKMEAGPEKPVSDIDVLMDIPLSISVELGKSKCYVRDLLNLTVGSIVELDRLAGDPVDILVNGKLFAKGEVVVIDENFGVRIQEVIGKDKQQLR